MKTNICNIYDLENTLISIDRKVWIIDKNTPIEPILKINESDFKLIDSGIFRNQDNRVEFNGKTYFISTEMMENLENLTNKKGVKVNNLGISMREYIDKEYIDKLKFEILNGNITHLRNKIEDFYIISSRLIEDKYRKLTNKLEYELVKEGIKIEKIYYINETFYNQDENENSYKKAVIILQHLFGLKIEDHKFISQSCKRYNSVSYYDALPSNINDLKNINTVLDSIYTNTEDTSLKEVIKTIIKIDLKVQLNLVTTNEINRFNNETIDIQLLIKESYIKRYNRFRSNDIVHKR